MPNAYTSNLRVWRRAAQLGHTHDDAVTRNRTGPSWPAPTPRLFLLSAQTVRDSLESLTRADVFFRPKASTFSGGVLMCDLEPGFATRTNIATMEIFPRSKCA